MQSQSSRDTEILEERIHIAEDMEVTQEQPQQHEEIEGQGSDTQELVALHLPIKATTDNQEDGEIEIQEEVATQEPTPSQSDAEVSIGELQGEYVVTHEPKSPKVVSEAPRVEVAAREIQGRGVITQEPTPP